MALKARDEAEYRRDRRRYEAEQQAYAVDDRQHADVHDAAYRERRDDAAALYRAVDALPREQHEDGEDERRGVEDEGYPHGFRAVLARFHYRAACDHRRKRDALEARVDEGVEDGLGHVSEALAAEVREHDGEDGIIALEYADGVYRYRGDEYREPHVCRGGAHDARAEYRQQQHERADRYDADVVVEAEIGRQRRGRARYRRGDRHQHHDVEEELEDPDELVVGMIERFEELLVVREAARVVHHHRLAHRQRQQKHRERRGEHAGPAEIDVVGVGLVARREAAARVGREENRADREGGEERRFCGISVFHYIFLLQKIFRLSGGTKKSFRPSCSVQKRRKD